MNIVLAVLCFFLGASLMAAAYNQRERNLAEMAKEKAESKALEKEKAAFQAIQNTAYYQREMQYWKGIAYGDKAQTIYGAAIQSLQDGSGFAFQTKSNVIPLQK